MSHRGSPPRVRGIPTQIENLALLTRITPACAGNTSLILDEVESHGDHPRVCGEYVEHQLLWDMVVGSPPRVRGILNRYPKVFRAMGITPACAGNTEANFAGASGLRDHPRVCGEYSCLLGPRQMVVGSPPRVRGILACFMAIFPYLGITPACAGNTTIAPTSTG